MAPAAKGTRMADLCELAYEKNWKVKTDGNLTLKWGGQQMMWFNGVEVYIRARTPGNAELTGRRILAEDFSVSIGFSNFYWGPTAGIRLGITSRFRTRDMVVIDRQSLPDGDERFYSNCFVDRRWEPDPATGFAGNANKMRIARRGGIVTTSAYSGRWHKFGQFDYPLYYDDVFLLVGVYNHIRKKPPLPRIKVGIVDLEGSW